MGATIRAVFALLLSYGLLLLANGMFNTLLGVRTRIEGIPTEAVGVITASYFLGLLVGALRAVKVVAAVGHIRAFAAFASVMSVSALMHVLVVDTLAWCLIRFGAGFCMAGMVMVTESWLNERADKGTRGQVMSLYMITNYFASGCGQFVLPLGDPASFELFSVASIVFSLALVPVLLTRARAPRPVPADRLPFRALWATSPLGFIAAACAGAVNASFFGLAPVFAHEIGLGLAGTSTFMASVIFGGLAFQWHVGRLSDRVDRRWVLVGVNAGTALTCAGLAYAASHGGGTSVYVLGAMYGGLSFTVYSIAVAHTNDFADPSRLVQTAAGLLLAYGVGATLGPLAAGAAMGQLGPQGLFAWGALVNVGLGVFALARMLRRATPSRDERVPIVNLPGGQHTSGVLYRTLQAERGATTDETAATADGSQPEYPADR